MTKLPASWRPDQPGSVTIGSADTRVTTTDTRVIATGDVRVTSGVTIALKEATAWSVN